MGDLTLPLGRFVASGSPKVLWTGAPNPLLFARFFTQVYHPEYVYVLQQSDENPWLFRTVTLPPFQVRRWRDLLDAREPLVHEGIGEIRDVAGHLVLFVKEYLPALDARGGAPKLAPLLPLFEEMTAYAREALMNRTYSPGVEERRRESAEADARLRRSRQRAVDALEASLAEVRNLVSLDVAGRARLRVLRSGLRSKAAVFEELLTGNDRERLDAILETWWQHLRARERFDGEAAWSDGAGEIAYAVHYRDESFLKTSADQRISCLRIALDVDASASFETAFDGLSQKLRPSLCRHEAGDWRLH